MNESLTIACDPDNDSFESIYKRVFEEFFEKREHDEILVTGLEFFISHDLKNALEKFRGLDSLMERLSMPMGAPGKDFRIEETEKGLLITRNPQVKMPDLGPPAF